jgi:hypothetical protein
MCNGCLTAVWCQRQPETRFPPRVQQITIASASDRAPSPSHHLYCPLCLVQLHSRSFNMEEDVRTVHYATQDDMPNFKLRVTLTRLSATRPRPSTAAVSASTASSAASQPAVDRRQACAKHVRTFTWQEKVYSKAELVMAQVSCPAGGAPLLRRPARRHPHPPKFGAWPAHTYTGRCACAAPAGHPDDARWQAHSQAGLTGARLH